LINLLVSANSFLYGPDGDTLYDFGGYGANAFKWVPDFSTGTVSRLSPNDYRRKAGLEKDMVRDTGSNPEELTRFLGSDEYPKEEEKPKKEDIRRETMKIGKFLSRKEKGLRQRHEALDNATREDARGEYDEAYEMKPERQ
jgi:hypothetical protein